VKARGGDRQRRGPTSLFGLFHLGLFWSCPCRMHSFLLKTDRCIRPSNDCCMEQTDQGVAYCDKGHVEIECDMKVLSSIPALVGALRNMALILISCCLSLSALDTTLLVSPYLASYTNSHIKEQSRLDQHHHRHHLITAD